MPNAKMASPGMRERAYAWATAIGLQDVSPLSSGSFYRWRRNWRGLVHGMRQFAIIPEKLGGKEYPHG